jgi:hypothetical protein
MSICAQDSPVHLNIEHTPATDTGLPQMRLPCLKFCYKYTISPGLSLCQIGLANKRCWICHNTTQNICRLFSGVPELESIGCKRRGFARDQPSRCLKFRHRNPISPWHTILPDWIAESALSDVSKRDLWRMTYGQHSLVRLKVVELCMVHSVDLDWCTWPQVSGGPQNHYWWIIQSPSLRHSRNSTQAIYPLIAQSGNL